MAIEILIGPPASGKTETCLRRIHEIRRSGMTAQVQVIVPDRIQAAGFRRKLAARPDVDGTDVSTFRQFANRILEQSGRGKSLIGNPLALRLVQKAISSAAGQAALIHYALVWETAGFAKLMLDTFSRFEKNGISADVLTTQATNAEQTEIARIYTVYSKLLAESGWISPAGLLNEATETLVRNSAAILQNAFPLLILDGFDSFDRDQLLLIHALEPYAENMLITLPGSADEADRYAYRRFTRSLEEIRPTLLPAPKISSLRDPVFLPADIAHIVQNAMNPGIRDVPQIRPEGLEMIEAGSREDEVREVLRRIKRWVLRKNVRPGSCAIFTPSPEEYAPLFRRLGREMGIPLQFGRREALIRLPAARALIRLLRLYPENYPTRGLIHCLRSPFFDFELSPDQVRQLDWISRKMRIVSGRDQWAESWKILNTPANEPVTDEDGSPAGKSGIPSDPEALSQLQAWLARFFEVTQPPAGWRREADWIHWLENLLSQLRYWERFAPDESADGSVLQTCFQQTLLHARLVEGEPLSYSAFLSNLNGILSAAETQEPPAGGYESVFVGDIAWARGARFEAAALTGFSEGLFPAPAADDPVPDPTFRQRIGLPALEPNDQNALFIQAIARADRYLLISRPALTDEGEPWEESQYWAEIRRLSPAGIIERIRSASPRALSEAASPGERRFWQALYNGTDANPPDAPQPAGTAGGQENHPVQLQLHFNQAEPENKIYSASQLETALYCPLRYFITEGLQLTPAPAAEYGLDTLQLGSLLHRILQLTFSDMDDLTDSETLVSRMEEICDRVFAEAPRKYRFRPSALWPFEQQQLHRQLQKTLAGLSADSAGWQVHALEQRFGTGEIPPLSVETAEGTLQFRGIIDRIDRNANGRFRVIDYKTGSAHLSMDDFWSGRRMQIFLYALAAADVLQMGPVEEGFYWSLLASKKSGLKLSSFMLRDEWDRTPTFRQSILEKITQFQTMLREAVFPADPIEGKCPEYCSAAAWCSRFVRAF